MRIREFGTDNKETMIFLHGGGLSWWNYRREAELLSSDYHIVLPILDGHADSDRPFTSIEDNASEIIRFIDENYNGSVLLIGGLSLGAQVLLEILSQRTDICRYAVAESASVIPSKITNALIGPSIALSYGLIKKRWFAKQQFKALHIQESLFEEYFSDTPKITKRDMIAFLKANTAYKTKPELQNCQAQVRIIVGAKEHKKMIRSAELLNSLIPGSRLEIKDGLHHGEYSINHPELFVKELINNSSR